MAKRHANHRLVKIHRNYTVEEIASLLHVHKNTVRAWIKAGLATCDRRRPTLVVGYQLAAFLRDRRASKKQPCGPGQIYCVRCRAPKFPAGAMTEWVPINEKLGNLRGICPDCDSMMYRRASLMRSNLGVGDPDSASEVAVERLSDTHRPTVNSVLREGSFVHD